MFKFLIEGGKWYGLLEDMGKMIHDKTLWRDRDVAAMAKVRVGLSLLRRVVGRAQWIGKEVHDFIYGEEEVPFLIVSIVVLRLELEF